MGECGGEFRVNLGVVEREGMEIEVVARGKFEYDGVEAPVIGLSDDVVWAVKATLYIAADKLVSHVTGARLCNIFNFLSNVFLSCLRT